MSASAKVGRWRLLGAVAVAVLVGACSSATGVGVPRLEIFVASGDGQYGTTNQPVRAPLQVHVRGLDSQLPKRDVNVVWTIVSGAAQIVSAVHTLTDSTGAAQVSVRLGATTGQVVVRATIERQEEASADFRLFVVDQPVLTSITPAAATPGASIVVTGENFSPTAAENVVLFSGVRGRVTSATTTQLTVTVPSCLPARPVDVRVQLGIVGSDTSPFTVQEGGTVTSIRVGDVVDLTDPAGFDCVTIPGTATTKYLVMVQSASSLGAAAHPFVVTGLGDTPPVAAAAAYEMPAAAAVGQRLRVDAEPDPQSAWDLRLREQEAELMRERAQGAAGPARSESSARTPPVLNEMRDFQVYRNPGDFVDVTATARFVGARAALFVDEDAPAGGYTEGDLEAFSDQFDDVIYPAVTGAFGGVSDLDANERVIILFTPAVNALTPRGSNGFIAGFFFGLDLNPEEPGSNGGELFYALVPDPGGSFGDPRRRGDLLDIMPAILGHEFQHMVSYNERVLVAGAAANEAVWLSEALAQYAEELVARVYEDLGDGAAADLFRDGIRKRSRRYLAGPESVSLIISAGSGSLAERGAGYLYMTYLADRFGANLPGRLVRTTRTGVANVEAQTGTDWASGLSDWWSAVYLDGPGPEAGDLVYPTVDLRGFLGDPFPLAPEQINGGDFAHAGSLRSSAAEYYIVYPTAGGSTTFRVGGEGGAGSPVQSALRLRIVRLQ